MNGIYTQLCTYSCSNRGFFGDVFCPRADRRAAAACSSAARARSQLGDTVLWLVGGRRDGENTRPLALRQHSPTTCSSPSSAIHPSIITLCMHMFRCIRGTLGLVVHLVADLTGSSQLHRPTTAVRGPPAREEARRVVCGKCTRLHRTFERLECIEVHQRRRSSRRVVVAIEDDRRACRL